MRYLTAQEILILHALVIDETGGSHGVRDIGLLQAIAAKPQASFGGKDLYEDIFLKAAILLEAIANYHVFVDGNKRTALTAAARFLDLNGYMFDASNKDAEDTMVQIAIKELDIEDVADWLEGNSRRK